MSPLKLFVASTLLALSGLSLVAAIASQPVEAHHRNRTTSSDSSEPSTSSRNGNGN